MMICIGNIPFFSSNNNAFHTKLTVKVFLLDSQLEQILLATTPLYDFFELCFILLS
uniref:Uncharacterized protein n=1 Tax=Arundo donax TaxID=35708 RepID=A0A0A8XR42_ARUDO